MPDPGVLHLIAAKEQELRVQLMAVRAEGDALVRAARGDTAAWHSVVEAAAVKEAHDWLEQEVDRARREAEQLVGEAADALQRRTGVARLCEAAVQHLLDEILVRAEGSRP
jgi:vacuolar-type H+-ATPase subunit H